MAQTVTRPPTGTEVTDLDEHVVVGSYPSYDKAQRAMDFLAEQKFPIAKTAIVGTNLRLVEGIMGPLTWRHSVGGAAATGAWFGLLVSLMLSLFGPDGGSALPPVLGVVYGALFGAAFGLTTYWAARWNTRGRRGFISRSSLVADRYDIVTAPDVAEEAKNLLIKYGWRTG